MLDLIIKPQNKKGQMTLKKVRQRLDGENIPYEVHFTEGKGDAQRIARELTEQGRCDLVVIGGDGSLNDVLTGMRDPSLCRLGLIPAGTGNDFSVSARIPAGEAALDLILKGEPKPTDYIDCSDGRRSLNIAGMGIDVDILLRCEKMKGFHDKSKYFFSLLASLMKYSGCELTIRAGGEEIRKKVLIAALCNGKQLGGGIPMCPAADISDGLLDVVVVDCPKRSKIPGALLKLMQGKVLSLPFATHFRCEEASVIPASPAVAQYDGELYQTAAMEATLKKGGLLMYRP